MSDTTAAPAATGASASPSASTSSTPPSSSTTSSATASPPASESSSGTIATTPGTAEGKAEASAQAAQKAEEVRKWKLKVNGQERELGESELLRRAQLGYSADEKFQQASEMRQMTEQFFDALKKNPLAVLTHPELGINFREVAEGYLAKELQREMLPPEQRELEDLREFKRKQEEDAQTREQEQMTQTQQNEARQLQARAAKEYDTKITEVLQATNLPKTPYTVKRVAELLKGALTKGYDLDVQTAVDMVNEGYNKDFKSLFGGLKGEPLVKFLGDDVLREIRQYDLARIKAKLESPAAPAQATPPSTPRTNTAEQPQMRPAEWLDMVRKKAGI